ncbi:MAG: helix-turn-helix transcriptional regulator [Ruminococcaceae bacterium]|nr:helix-turn-helix transcriptional regulator [Oscillospiraceae bacterium]
MEKTIGKKLYDLRKQSGFTQDYVAEKLGVSAQAVSKWENDIACPDIMTLPNIAEIYGITIDELFKNEEVQSNVKYEKPEKINENELVLRVYVDTIHGDDIKVNLPYLLIKELINVGKDISSVFTGIDLSGVNFESIFKMVEMGVLGEIVNVKTQNGDIVRVVVEK